MANSGTLSVDSKNHIQGSDRGHSESSISAMTRAGFLLLLSGIALQFLPCLGNLENNPLLKRKLNITFPDYTMYHHMNDLLGEVDALVNRHPNIMHLDVLKSEVDGYSTEMRVVTVSPGGLNDDPNGKLRLLLNFGEHARELVTSELALRILEMLGGETNIGIEDGESLAQLLPLTALKIIPMENVHGRVKVEDGDLCERKNGRGVDTNRNWEVDWGKKEKDYDPNEEYPGTAPFSEPETRILRQLVRSFDPHVWVNVHSGMEALFMPYDHKKMIPNDGGGVAMDHLLQTLNKLHCSGSCVVGSGGTSVGYLSHGTATDYMYDILKVPISLTFEIFGDESAANDDCFRMFNPVDNHELEIVVSKWSAIFFSLLVNLPTALLSMPSRISESPWWEFTMSIPVIQDSGLRKRIMSLYKDKGPKKFGRLWHGMDTMAAGKNLNTIDLHTTLEIYFIFCIILLMLIWFRCSRYYKRSCALFRPVSYS